MNATEKVAYLKGLMEGLTLDESAKETKLFRAIADVLDDLSMSIDDLEDEATEMFEQIEAIDEDLGALEDDFYEDEDEDEEDDESLYEITCPSCGDSIYVDEGMLEEGSIHCPNCDELLEFDLDGCDCGCECCGHEDEEDK